MESPEVEEAGPESAPLEKTERLGCLYLTFLNHPAGLSFQRIKEFLPLAYGGDPESARRKFERDKEELKRLGLSLQHFPPGAALPGGGEAAEHTYVPEEEFRRLPELTLDPGEASELAAVLLAAMEQYRTSEPALVEHLQSAATKLLYRHPLLLPGGGAPLPPPLGQSVLPDAGRPLDERLGLVMDALHRRRVLRIRYPSRDGSPVDRTVEGRGLLTHRGRWCLVAFCRRVQAVRSFYLDRIESVQTGEETFRPDPRFQIKDYSLHPLGLRLHPVESIELEIETDREELWRDFLTGLPAFLRAERNGERFRLATTNREALFSWMIRNPGAVRRLGPESVRAAFEAHRAAMEAPYAILFDQAAGAPTR